MTEVRSTCDVDQGVADWLQNKMYDEVRDLIARAASEISHVEEIADEIAGIMRKAVLPAVAAATAERLIEFVNKTPRIDLSPVLTDPDDETSVEDFEVVVWTGLECGMYTTHRVPLQGLLVHENADGLELRLASVLRSIADKLDPA